MSTINQLAGGIVFIRQESVGSTLFSIDNRTSWNTITWPCTIVNSSAVSPPVIVRFETDIILNNVNQYFICGSPWIQFGDTCLRSNGTRPQITVTNVTGYPGLIKNFVANSVSGYSNISIYTLFVHSEGSSLAQEGGWIGQGNFARSASANTIMHCASDGPITTSCGGIVGSNTAIGGEIVIEYCSSAGTIFQGGGIIGSSAGSSGAITIHRCYSTGDIEEGSGGVIGINSGTDSGTIVIEDCYSQGAIGNISGGIAAFDLGIYNSSGPISISRCYSRGSIGSNAGGIIGFTSNSIIRVDNCYSTGIIEQSGGGGGIIVPGDSVNMTNCYAANGSWNDTTAATLLQNLPNSNGVGVIWSQVDGATSPYVLSYQHGEPSPYNLCITDDASSTVAAGEATVAAVVPGYMHQLLQINDLSPSAFPTITIDADTGAIVTTVTTPPGTYDIYIYSHRNPYSTTLYTLTVTEAPVVPSCCAPIPRDLDYAVRADVLSGNIFNSGIAAPPRYSSYSEYIKKRIALAFIR